MKEKFYQFMQGRYGADDLSKFMLGSAVAVMVLNLFLRAGLLNTLVLAVFAAVYFRMFSKNIQARYQENLKYLELKNRVLRPFKSKGGFSGMVDQAKKTAQDRKENHIYTCPSCGQKIRIPRGKGTIIVTCPKCRHEFQKKS